jgi:bifunctional DNA-binding transcriptional regulator/antitoxin component of YhaV-PrlF toxin-antitoxin module
VGAEAECAVTFNKQTSTGKALLETNEIIFRGDFRLKIDLKSISALDAKAGRLQIVWPDGTATFALGDKALSWAEKIRNPKGLLEKLGIKPGQRVVVLHMRDDAFASQLREAGASVFTRAAKDADALFLGAESIAGLAGMRLLVDQIKRDGAIWTVTPKGKGGIKDIDIFDIAKAAGLVALKVVSFSETHSANKFVIPKGQR